MFTRTINCALENRRIAGGRYFVEWFVTRRGPEHQELTVFAILNNVSGGSQQPIRLRPVETGKHPYKWRLVSVLANEVWRRCADNWVFSVGPPASDENSNGLYRPRRRAELVRCSRIALSAPAASRRAGDDDGALWRFEGRRYRPEQFDGAIGLFRAVAEPVTVAWLP